jgi:hypothetical protein
MRRLLAVTFIAPAVLAAAEQVKPGLLDRALTRGVTNDRPYRPVALKRVISRSARWSAAPSSS